MQLKNIFTDDDAVSPVIGVILMVAITVILAAVIGAFVLGIGGSQETVPNANFDFNHDGTDPTVTHQGGDAINYQTLTIQTAAGDHDVSSSDVGSNDVWEAGETITAATGASSGTDISVIWSSTSSDKSQIIGSGTAE